MPASQPPTALPEDTEGLHPIANTTLPSRVADVVFVHGLGGGSHSTWQHKATDHPQYFFWPEELGKELPQCGVWSLGYEAGVVPWFGADGLSIAKRAKNLAHKLTTAKLGDRPILFITHSMGGLMVKEIVVQSQMAGDTNWKSLVEQIVGIVFCGTPHRGAAVPRMAKVLAPILRTQMHLQNMASGEERLEELHDQFHTWQATRRPHLRLEAYAEGIGLKRHHWWLRWLPALLAVTPDSANPQIYGCRCIPCNEDHLSLVKPSHHGHDVYAGVRKLLEEILATLPPPATAPSGISDAFILGLWKWLKSVVSI